MFSRRSLFVFILTSIAIFSRAETSPRAPVLLVSLDGFRWDYCEKYPAETPTMRRLKREGASARGLITGFPSNTFPSHYSIVTGLRPTSHGIINNHLFDAKTGRFFHYNQPASARDGAWWGGEPVWITAVRQGRVSACAFWPGSEAPFGAAGLRATFWRPFDYGIPFETRLAELVSWFKLPVKERPAIITFYFEETNAAGHAYGPDSPEMAAAVKLLDTRLGELLARIEDTGMPVNVVVVSDHGMTGLSAERVVKLDDYLELGSVQIDFDGPVVGLRPLDGDVSGLMKRLAKLPSQARAYRREELPAHLHVGAGPRVPPVWILPDAGWHAVTTAKFNAKKDKYMKGEHGYDPTLPDMHGILVVHGPVFKSDGRAIPPTENIHIYNLLCAAVGLQPVTNDGDDRLVRAFLR